MMQTCGIPQKVNRLYKSEIYGEAGFIESHDKYRKNKCNIFLYQTK